jgi:hypothetical protein
MSPHAIGGLVCISACATHCLLIIDGRRLSDYTPSMFKWGGHEFRAAAFVAVVSILLRPPANCSVDWLGKKASASAPCVENPVLSPSADYDDLSATFYDAKGATMPRFHSGIFCWLMHVGPCKRPCRKKNHKKFPLIYARHFLARHDASAH